MSKYDYSIQTLYRDKWATLRSAGLQYAQGYLDAMRNYSPRNAYRILRSDGRVMESLQADDEVSVGMIAGFPTARQYECAAERALARASHIREREETQSKRHTS